MAQIARLTIYPVKSLDAVDVAATEILPGGTLAHDREFALFDGDGAVITGRRTDRMHDLSTTFDVDSARLTVSSVDGETRQFTLDQDRGRKRAKRWFGEFLDAEVWLRQDSSVGYVDRRGMGPSVVSTATLETVASWFEGMTTEGARRRLRANVEVSGVPPFWEDRFVGEDAPTFEAGGVRFEGSTPCARCVVPERDPETGDPIPEFRDRFVRKRRETFPDWADETAFDRYYAVMLIARVPEPCRGEQIHVGDPVRVLEASG
jgi:uncharacterized protein YcbX